MIFLNKTEASEKDFVSLLEVSKQKIEVELKSVDAPKMMDGVAFENFVYENMLKAATGSEFEGHVEQTGAHAFPDIVARKLYGVEVKMTTGDKWVSTGNSVLETTRVESVETIYMFFGKFGAGFEAKYRKYQDCLSEVGVTHSPRYKIDMDLPLGKSIFDKIGVDYNVFREEESPIKRLKEYYRGQLKEGEELWWIDPSSDEKSVSPVIKSLKLLDEEEKEQFIKEVFILFPEIFSNSNLKFEKAAAYLITQYNAVSSSLRDSFTAGGKMDIKIGKRNIKVSRLLYNLFVRARAIRELLEKMDETKLAYYWPMDVVGNRAEIWRQLISRHADNISEDVDSVDVWTVFQEGLRDV